LNKISTNIDLIFTQVNSHLGSSKKVFKIGNLTKVTIFKG